MGRKSTARKNMPTIFNKPKTNLSNQTTNNTNTPSIGSSIKQGMATGVGVGVGHAATMGVINAFTNGSGSGSENASGEIDTKRKNCINLFKMYQKCLETDTPNYNCSIIKEEFENCSKEF
tara:strand:- start:2545 stop:2904 length:360 start_codon:yes stop_codon:yes gene_type:complete